MLTNRRDVLRTGGFSLAGLAAPALVRARDAVTEITMRSDVDGAHVWFDPIGLLVVPGATIRWTLGQNVHTATAYHPDNDNHAQRIPLEAIAWDSDYLIDPGDAFQVELTVPGVYDYFCAPHEQGGMVGRIIVGHATGPGSLPFDYFKSQNPASIWHDVPEMAQRNFPAISDILANGSVRV